MKNNLTTFVYIGGRQSRINESDIFPKEFYYGFFEFKSKYQNVEMFELNKPNRSKIVIFLDKVMVKIFNLPIGFANVLTLRTVRQFKKSSNLILINEHVFFSTLIILFFLKVLKRVKITVFLMGMFEKIEVNNFLQKILIKFSFFVSDNLIFLGEGEFNYANKFYKNYKEKFYYIPFCVDQNFWEISEKYNLANRDFILFIGNDLNRDFEHLIEIVNLLQDEKFKIISTRIDEELIKLPNVEIVKGSWHNRKLSDEELRDLYAMSKLVIIPLCDTIQPSGQSVALQSMSCRTPVIISNTRGFWDSKSFIEDNNIFFFENNIPDDSVIKIRNLLKNQHKLNLVSANAYRTVRHKYSLDNFAESLEKIVFKAN